MWNRLVMHKQMGYDRFYNKSDYKIDDVVGLGLSDKSFFKQSIPMIKNITATHDKYYGTVIMLSNHTPFDDVDKYGDFPVTETTTKLNAEGVNETVTVPYMEGTTLGNYFKSVHYADAALGEFISGLDSEGLLDNTVVVIYGDHDARLPKDDYLRLYNYDPSTDSVKTEDDPTYKSMDYYDYELNRKVPLIVLSKDLKSKEITKVMGMYDVLPTLGNMFGFKSDYQLGSDIFSSNDNMVVFANGNWLTQDVYYNTQKDEFKLLNANAVVSQDIKRAFVGSELQFSIEINW
jgi:phosphoglycerol transferase MdoB-like AlkP superfamily enzyme